MQKSPSHLTHDFAQVVDGFFNSTNLCTWRGFNVSKLRFFHCA